MPVSAFAHKVQSLLGFSKEWDDKSFRVGFLHILNSNKLLIVLLQNVSTLIPSLASEFHSNFVMLNLGS